MLFPPKPSDWKITWKPRAGSRQPTEKPNPQYPNGTHLNSIHNPDRPSCIGDLPYKLWPERGLGILIIECRTCGLVTAVTTAGRPDDPITLTQNCKGQ